MSTSEDRSVESEAKSPEELRREIEQTRVELGDTVEALAAKTDVKAQAKEQVAALSETAQQKREEFTQVAQQKREEWLSRAKAAAPESTEAGVQQLSAAVRSNPLPFAAAGAFVAGVLIGRLTGRS